MTTSRTLNQLKRYLYNPDSNIARDVAGDLWDACDNDGTGVGKQVGLASYRASLDPRHVASMRFLTQKVHYLENASHIQQLMKFNEDKVRGEDTARVFARIFGEGNIFFILTNLTH